MRQWKIALSLALVGAIASPFALRTYKMPLPSVERWVSLAEEDEEEFRTDLVATMKRTNDCLAIDPAKDPWLTSSECYSRKQILENGGFNGRRRSMPIYLTMNAAAAILAFGAIFGLTYLLPALIRRYWRWLHT